MHIKMTIVRFQVFYSTLSCKSSPMLSMVQAPASAATPSPPRHPPPFKSNAPNQRHLKPRALHCFGKNGDINSLFRSNQEADLEGLDNLEISQEGLQLSNVEPQAKNKDIWRLFQEVQQNILYLNKQRLTAVKELNKLKRERDLLREQIDQLEAENQSRSQRDKLSLVWELLLHIDSMVLNGLINTEEASDLRKLVREHKMWIAESFTNILQKRDAEILAELRQFSNKSKRNGFHIIHICTEMAPLVTLGPLASYVTGISCALQGKSHLVEVILPKYSSLDLDEVQGLREIEADAYSYFNGQLHANRIWTGVVCGLGVTFIQPLQYSSFFIRDKVYGYSDDFERFSYFSRASLDYIVKSGKQPDVLHIHNWETAIVGPLFWDIFVKQGLEGTRILLTCQDFDSQCLVQPDKLELCGLDPARLHRPDRLQDNVKMHSVNILKGGIVYSNKVVMMSSMHSKERIIDSLSHGLAPTLAIHMDKLLLTPFGFDNSTWDPSRDRFLPENYSAEDMEGKCLCKVALQQELGLPEHVSTAIVGYIFLEISDLDLENLKAIVRRTIRTGIQFIFMGISEDKTIIRELKDFEEEFEEGNLKFLDGYDETLSRLIFAGSDLMLCQSFHDPTLQSPLKALKYGAVPVAITANNDVFGHFGVHDQENTRFSQFIRSTFGNVSLSQALDQVKNNSTAWKRKIADAMAKDFSWDAECCDIHVSAYTAIKNL